MAKINISPHELAKVLGIHPAHLSHYSRKFIGKSSEQPYRYQSFANFYYYEDALRFYIGFKLRDVGLNTPRIREICDWMREYIEIEHGENPLYYGFNNHFGIHIPMPELVDEFNRKLNEVQDGLDR